MIKPLSLPSQLSSQRWLFIFILGLAGYICWAREADTRDHFLYHDNKVVMDYQQHMYTPHYVLEEQTSVHAEFAELVFEDETSRNQSKAGEDMTPYFLKEGYPIARVVEWYSPWCGHCQNFVPKYVAIAEQISERLPPHSVEFHAVSCHEHRHLCQQFHVKGYPTIRAYPARAKDGIDVKSFTVRSISDILGLGITNSHAVKSVNERLDTPASSPTLSPQQKDPLLSSQFDDLGVSPKVDIIGASHDGHRHTRSDVYNDAAKSFTYALEHHIFQNGQQALTDHQAQTFSEWLDLLYWTLPPTWMIHTLIHELRRGMEDIVRSKELFMTVLRQQRRVVHHDDLQWSDVCLEQGDGYSCGVWNLFHIMSVGVMERHRSVLGTRDRITIRHAGESLKNYIDHFFPFCPECRHNFLAAYHGCAYKRCRRFRQRTRNKRTPPSQDSWKEFPLWLWEFHNGVTGDRLNNSTMGTAGRKLSAAEVRNFQWPSRGECHHCYKKNGNWDKQQVLTFLKDEYWPSGVHNFRYVILDRKDASYLDTNDLFWEQVLKIGVPAAVGFVAFLIWWRKRQRDSFVARGLHKKYY